MTKRLPTLLLALLAAALLALPTTAQDLVRGEDFVDTPAIGQGLFVSNAFQSNMVLQRGKPIAIWGWATPGEQVTVSFAGNSARATAGDDRAWRVELPALEANETPRAMTIKGKADTLTLDNILVGDVWVLGGQSNMEFPLHKVENGHLEILSANYPQIRILSVPQAEAPTTHNKGFPRIYQWSDWSSRHFRKGFWDECTPEIAKELSAIGYVFARRVHKASEVPTGVIDASRGGTTVETWTPLDRMRKMQSEPTQALLADWDAKVAAFDPQADLRQRIEKKKNWLKRMDEQGRELSAEQREIPSETQPGPIANHNHPGSCYGGMLAPFEGLSIKGAIFHQGFNNAFSGQPGIEMYEDVFPVMIEAWREAFNDPQMPFGILSLCTAGNPQTLENYSEMMLNNGIGIRAAQYKTFEELYKAGDKNIGFASTYDLRRSWYHPQVKLPAGERIARWALVTEYGFSDRVIPWKPPMITGMQVTDGKLIVSFDMDVANLEDGDMLGFAIAGKDRRFHPAQAAYVQTGKDGRGRPQYDKSKLELTSLMVDQPVHYRYAWGRNPLANIQATRNKDLPVGTQRSDDWPMHTVPRGVLPADLELPMSRGDRGKLLRELREMDRQRRIAEAKAVLEALQE